MKYEHITGTIIGCAMKVHRWFGPGFPEIIYQRSLLIELARTGLTCGSEISKRICYEGQLVGFRRLDIIVEGTVLIELKAVSELDGSCQNKILNYLKIFELEVGLLVNFGTQRLTYKRFVN